MLGDCCDLVVSMFLMYSSKFVIQFYNSYTSSFLFRIMFLYSSQQHCCFLYYRHSYRSFLSNAISLFCYYNYKISFSSPKQYYDNYFIFFSYSSIFYSKSNFYIANLCVNLLIYSCLTIMLSSLHLFSFSFSVLVLLISQKVYSLLLPKFLHLFYLLLNFSLMVFISLLFIFIFTTLISFFILYTALYLHPPIRLSLFHLRLFQYLKQILPQLNQQILIHLLIIPQQYRGIRVYLPISCTYFRYPIHIFSQFFHLIHRIFVSISSFRTL